MGGICICAALNPELQPLVRHFGLEKTAEKGISEYKNDDLCLVKTGVGASACQSVLQRYCERATDISAFINIGIAGGCWPHGTVVAAHTISSNLSARRFYPHLPPSKPMSNLVTTEVRSLTQPSAQYDPTAVYDMEAHAFYAQAADRVDSSRIQCLKVISDGPNDSLERIDSNMIGQLISGAIPTLENLLKFFQGMDNVVNRELDKTVVSVTSKIHHSVTERHRLRRLLQRYLTLNDLATVSEHWLQLNKRTSAKELARYIDEEIKKQPMEYR